MGDWGGSIARRTLSRAGDPLTPGENARATSHVGEVVGIARTLASDSVSDKAVIRIEAMEVVVEDEIGERDGHGDIEPLDEMKTADG